MNDIFSEIEVSRDTKVLLKKDEDISWEKFMPYMEDEEPSKDIRKSKRHQRKIFCLNENNGVSYYLKKLSYRHSRRLRDMTRGFFWLRSKARRQLHSVLCLKKTGINTIDPVLIIEHRYSWLKQQSLLVTRAQKGITLGKYLESNEKIDQKMDKIKSGFNNIYKMHKNNISHGDTNVANMILDIDSRLIWCDFDRLKKNPLYLFFKGRYYDLLIFAQSGILCLIRSGCWNSGIRSEYIRCFERAYPEYSIVRKIVLDVIGNRIKEF
ncbi:lipopolysaccharide kinase InaA family protein [Elusimicrobiota bacterium]